MNDEHETEYSEYEGLARGLAFALRKEGFDAAIIKEVGEPDSKDEYSWRLHGVVSEFLFYDASGCGYKPAYRGHHVLFVLENEAREILAASASPRPHLWQWFYQTERCGTATTEREFRDALTLEALAS